MSSGALFWPISLGLAGFWAMVILTVLVLPITFFSHQAYARFVQTATATTGKEGNLIDAAEEHLGVRWAKWLTFVYFITVFPAMMVYTITITNTLIDFFNTQLHLGILPRVVVAPLVVVMLLAVVQFNTTVTVKVMGFIVVPFIASLVFFGAMAAPSWNLSVLQTASNFGGVTGLMSSVWVSLPVAIYAMGFTTVVSSMVVAQKRVYGEVASKKVSSILLVAVILIFVTVVFFAWSCIFALSPQELAEAKANNLTALSYLARKFDNPLLATASQLIVFLATIKAFLAHFIATKESAKGFASTCLNCSPAVIHGKGLQRVLTLFIFVVTTLPAILNWNVLNLIQIIMVPASVFMAYFLPQYACYRIPALHQYRGKATGWFVMIVGTIVLINGVVAVLKL
ncbi:aromatic amino acid transport family protein [Pseudomonas sp. TE50-2]|uniref:aromatic amino acid transport family protein n=1 Tax=Pseudomonas sp. TE50-2 TaxID=3142707 RepID=UPI0034666A41